MPPFENGAQEAADLRSILAEATEQAEKDGAQPTETTEQPSEQPSEADKDEPKAGQRARDDSGRFLPKDKAEAEPPEKPATEPTGERKAKEVPDPAKTETEAPAGPESPQQGIEAPQHWSAADKAWLKSLPAEHQGSVLERFKQMEAGFTPKLQRLSHYERDLPGVMELFAPHVEALRQQNKTPGHIIQQWAGVEKALLDHKGAIEASRDPGTNGAEVVARMILGYRIHPKAVADALNAMASGQTSATQPAFTQLPPEVMAKLDRLEQAENQRTEQAGQQRLSTAQQQIDVFAAEKAGDGNPKHPFFADLESDMMAFALQDMRAGKTPNLSDLYDRAVWANPDTRGKLLALQKEQSERAAAVQRKADSEAARKASVSVTGAPGAARQPQRQSNSNRSLRDQLAATYEELEGAA